MLPPCTSHTDGLSLDRNSRIHSKMEIRWHTRQPLHFTDREMEGGTEKKRRIRKMDRRKRKKQTLDDSNNSSFALVCLCSSSTDHRFVAVSPERRVRLAGPSHPRQSTRERRFRWPRRSDVLPRPRQADTVFARTGNHRSPSLPPFLTASVLTLSAGRQQHAWVRIS